MVGPGGAARSAAWPPPVPGAGKLNTRLEVSDNSVRRAKGGNSMTGMTVKQCPGCGACLTLQQIRDCDDIRPLGMQVIGPGLKGGVAYFNHTRPGCGTTFVVPVIELIPLITEPIPDAILTGTESCERHCLTLADLGECGQPCLYAPFRRLIISMVEQSAGRPQPVTQAEMAHTDSA